MIHAIQKRLILLAGTLLFWYLLFVLARLAFLAYHYEAALKLPLNELTGTFMHGFLLDLSMSAYLSILPGILLLISFFGTGKWLTIAFQVYTLLLSILFSLLIVVDINLYSYWGFRLDATPLFYMSNLKAMTASVSVAFWLLGIFAVLLLAFGIYRLYLRFFIKSLNRLERKTWASLLFVPILLMLFIPIRGGIGISSLTISSAYFSQQQFANHAAINPMWNVAFSITESKDIEKRYEYYDEQAMLEYVSPLYLDTGTTLPLLKNNHPNIILIIVESLTAKAVGVTSKMKGITPNLDSLAREGILFDKIFASAERTDKGLAAVIAGYPSLPGSTPLKYQKLTEKLCFLPAQLNKLGYESSFIYGGTLDFANYRSFLMQAGYKHFISEIDYTSEELASKWGAWDHVLFKYFLDATPSSEKGFFKTILTLTSHEPFEIPTKALLEGNDTETKFLNSLHYTDQAIGDFVREARKRDWWSNTLLIITADHGSQWPGNTGTDNFYRQHIPMIWLGGAVAKNDTVIHTLGSQTDIPATLLSQLGADPSGFLFSKNLLGSTPVQYAFYTFNEGFGYITHNDFIYYNLITNDFSGTSSSQNPDIQRKTKSYLQLIYSDFFRKKSVSYHELIQKTRIIQGK